MSNAQNSDKNLPEHNKAGHQAPSQKNEPRRTPESRSDRESHIGGSNQSSTRKGGGAAGGKH